MKRFLRRLWADERGSVLALVAVSIVALVAMSSLMIDAGMLYTAHDEAQRAADASALAGVARAYYRQSYADPAEQARVDLAKQAAKLFAQKNDVAHTRLDTTLILAGTLTDSTAEVVVQVIPVSVETGRPRVRVTVRRRGIGLWFGNLLGMGRGGVTATAVAEASAAGLSDCLAPIALPDIWDERQGDTNGDRVWEEGENWDYDPTQDHYRQLEGPLPDGSLGGDTIEVGYGSEWRNTYGSPSYVEDRGRKLLIKPQRPPTGKNGTTTWNPETSPGWFFPWRIGSSTGANDYKQNWLTCNEADIQLGSSYDLEMGNMVGPTKQAVNQLMSGDPAAQWDSVSGSVTGSTAVGGWENSPRVIKVGLYDPAMLDSIAANVNNTGSAHTIKFNNFALLWLEGLDCSQSSQPGCQDAPVIARFLYYVPGTGGGAEVGSLAAYPRLVK